MQAHVCAAKAGVDMLDRRWRSNGAATASGVNSVIPGPIEGTEGMARLAPTPDKMSAIAAGVPLGRLATGRRRHLVMFLASPLAAYVTGAVIPVDGGWSANGAAGWVRRGWR